MLAKAQAALRFVRGALLCLLGLALLLRLGSRRCLLRFLRFFLALLLLVVGVAARVEAQAAVGLVDEDFVGQAVDEETVMRDEEDRAAEVVDERLEHGHGLKVEVVRRLI